jgi:DNA-binding NtrC family response regulator
MPSAQKALLAMILQKSGFDATPFTQPLRALEASRTDSPDLLISDVMMPELNGIELATQMQQVCPSCRVLLFSGQANTQMLLDSARASGNHFECVGKPVHPTTCSVKSERDSALLKQYRVTTYMPKWRVTARTGEIK